VRKTYTSLGYIDDELTKWEVENLLQAQYLKESRSKISVDRCQIVKYGLQTKVLRNDALDIFLF
jgi:hypothetical protein